MAKESSENQLTDKENNDIYFYNSCPKTFELVNELFSKWFPKMMIYNNNYQNQFDNMLCGFFSTKFLNDVAYADNIKTGFN